jgi:hypothetical protein
MEEKQPMSVKHRSFIIAFWSFFTGLQLERGLDRLHSSSPQSEWMFSFTLAIVCSIGVAIHLHRMIRSQQAS